jgi:hypothetical protein
MYALSTLSIAAGPVAVEGLTKRGHVLTCHPSFLAEDKLKAPVAKAAKTSKMCSSAGKIGMGLRETMGVCIVVVLGALAFGALRASIRREREKAAADAATCRNFDSQERGCTE